jgi:hypothetical protein
LAVNPVAWALGPAVVVGRDTETHRPGLLRHLSAKLEV